MKERYYAGDGKTYAIREFGLDDGRTVYYDGWFAKREVHEVKLYDWAKGLHGNAPSRTPPTGSSGRAAPASASSSRSEGRPP